MKTGCLLAGVTAATLIAGAGRLGAQVVRGTVILPDSSRAAGVIVVATSEGGAPAARALTGERGEYELRLPAAGRYEIRVLRIGFRPTVEPPFEIGPAEIRTLPIVLRGEAIVLAPVTVEGKSVCRVRQDSGQGVARLWEEARTAITATELTPTGGRQTVTWQTFDRTTDIQGRSVLSQISSSSSAAALKAFVSLPPDSLARVGYMSEDESGTVYRAPDAEALLSDQFAALHCFRQVPSARSGGDWVGIGFRPAKTRRGNVDIEGTLWLDRETSELRELDFTFTNLPEDYQHTNAGGTVEFLRLATGGWIIRHWQLRMPRTTRQLVSEYSPAGAREQYRTVVDGLQFTGGQVTSVTRGLEVLFGTGGSTHDYSPALLAEDARLAAACVAETRNGVPLGSLRGTVFEGAHAGIARAAVRVSWREEIRAEGQRAWQSSNEQRGAATDAAGNWRLCGIPRDRVLTVRATAGARASAPVTLRIPREREVAGVDVEVPPP